MQISKPSWAALRDPYFGRFRPQFGSQNGAQIGSDLRPASVSLRRGRGSTRGCSRLGRLEAPPGRLGPFLDPSLGPLRGPLRPLLAPFRPRSGRLWLILGSVRDISGLLVWIANKGPESQRPYH